MFKKFNWQQPIYKGDLQAVLINGFLTALLCGLLGGAVDYLLEIINVPIAVSLVLLAFAISYRVKKAYYSYHILYPTLTIVFMLFGIFISYTMNCILPYIVNKENPLFIFIDPYFYLGYLLLPFDTLILGITYHDILYILLGILNVSIYGYTFYLCFSRSKQTS